MDVYLVIFRDWKLPEGAANPIGSVATFYTSDLSDLFPDRNSYDISGTRFGPYWDIVVDGQVLGEYLDWEVQYYLVGDISGVPDDYPYIPHPSVQELNAGDAPDTTAPTPIANLAMDSGASDSDLITFNPALVGLGDANAIVQITVDGSVVADHPLADGSGHWKYVPPDMGDGSHTIVVSETDAAGNTGTASITFTLDTTPPQLSVVQVLINDTGASNSDRVTNDGRVNLSGEVHDAHGVWKVEIFDGASYLGSATISEGHWTYSATLAEGLHALSAVAFDVAGNSTLEDGQSTIFVDTTRPVPVMLNARSDPGTGTTLFVGQSESGSSVSVYDAGRLIGMTSADEHGTWSLTATGVTGNVVHHYSESSTDLAGNVGASLGLTLYTPAANKTLTGGTGDDVLIAQPRATLIGGAGSDMFVFNVGVGKVTVADFDVARDALAFDHRLFHNASPEGVLGTVVDGKSGAVITADTGESVTLTGIRAADLTMHATDFHFF